MDGVNIAKSLEAMTGEALADGRMKINLDLPLARAKACTIWSAT